MVRTQVQLTEAQAQGLKDLAVSSGTSMAGLVRQAVDELLTRGRPNQEDFRSRARAAAGRFRSGISDLGAKHDRYLAEVLDPS